MINNHQRRVAWMLRQLVFSGLILGLLISFAARADVTEFSLEQLMQMTVTSVSKKDQKLSQATAAIYVITREDIARSGLSSIPELLRQVPGLQVAQIDAHKWAISARGFNGRWASKLLVLMDGRTLYTPLFSGVYWDVQDTVLQDIERIEVIRGPGGTIWGANAVNGVINIITRNSSETQGGMATATLGNITDGAAVRYGGKLGKTGSFRSYVKADDHDNFKNDGAHDAVDAWDNLRLGFRTDWTLTADDALTIQGDWYKSHSEQRIGSLEDAFSDFQFVYDRAKSEGNNLLLHWRSNTNTQPNTQQDSGWSLKAYWDHAKREDLSLQQDTDTVDVEFNHHFSLNNTHALIWGLGYRHIANQLISSFTVSFDPMNQNEDIFNGFIQDDIAINDAVNIIIGSKFEHDTINGFDVQPSTRLLWKIDDSQTFWAALSKAVSRPSRSVRDIRINVVAFSSPFVDPDGPGPLAHGAPTLLSLLGNKEIKPEKLLAWEMGYRSEPISNLSVDIATFYNHYDDLLTNERSFAIEGSPIPTNAVIRSTFDNQMKGDTWGMELTTNWQVNPDWRVTASYSWLQFDLALKSGSTDVTKVEDTERSAPQQQYQLHAYWDIQPQLKMNFALYHSDKIYTRNAAGLRKVPAYTRFDISFQWQIHANIMLNLGGRNLTDNQHPEFFTTEVNASHVPRSVYGQLQFSF
jgi:iron complex outermembrane receptor protein